MSHELKGREIFAVGTWNGIDFVEEDLDELISNFDKLKENFKVPLKFGHDEDHKDGQPAIGWVSRIFKEGGKLFADFTDMPKVVYDAVQAKLYRTISVEILLKALIGGEKFYNVLDAVALLGADRPAVSGLADLNALLAKRTGFTGGHRVAFETNAGAEKFEMKKEEEVGLEASDVKKLITDAMAPVLEESVKLKKELADEKVKTAKFASDKADDEKTALEGKVKLARKGVTDVLDAAVRLKALTPANRTVYEKQIGVDNDERVLEIDVEQIKTMFSVKTVEGKQVGLHKDTDENDDDPEAQLMELTRKNQVSNGKDFGESFRLTCSANPELHKAYLDTNGEK